jgi:hypothetical protein
VDGGVLRAVLDVLHYRESSEGRMAYKYIQKRGWKVGGWCWVIEHIGISNSCKIRIEEYIENKWNGKL